MSKHDLHGQKNLTLAVGAPGDRTITVGVVTTHVRLKNFDPKQSILYSLILAPAFPTDWNRLEPNEQLDVRMLANPQVHLRKPFWYREATAGVEVSPGEPDVLDVPSLIEVMPVDWS